MATRRGALAGLGAGAALLALLAVALASASPRAGEAQTVAPPATRVVRVVFAIDNSCSMFEVSAIDTIDNPCEVDDEPASDPDEQRVEGVKRLIGVMRGFLGAADERRTVEIGALSFGSARGGRAAVEALFPPSPVIEPGLAEGLRAGRAEPRGGTDFAAALCGAWAMATGLAPEPTAGCELPPGFFDDAGVGSEPPAADWEPLVVLITDGSPAPEGPSLRLDGDPPASACADAAGFATADGDEYLCSLAATWAELRAQSPAGLIVIGLDAADRWFPDAEDYWQRTVGCGEFVEHERDCDDLVVRSVNPDELAVLILGAFPTVDLCEAVEDEPYTCDVPGGLVSVGFQINGVAEDTITEAANEATGDRWRSADRPPQFSAPVPVPDAHVWRFARPEDGRWTLTSDGPRSQLVLVDYDPALFGIEPLRWDASGLTLGLIAHEPIHVRSAERQPYRVELRRDGAPVAGEEARLTHEGDRVRFALTAPGIARPAAADAAEGDYDVVLYLRTPRKDIEVGREPLDAFLAATEPTATPTPAPTPVPTPEPTPPPPPPSCVDFTASWEGEPGEARRWQMTARLAWPPLPPVRFREAAPQRVTIDSADCGEPIEATADILGCEACTAKAEGPPPLGLTVPASGQPGGDAERRTTWYAPSSGVEDSASERVRVSGPALLDLEPWWGWALHLLAILGLFAAMSAVSVHSPKVWNREGDRTPPVRLAVPSEERRLIGIVRWRAFVWRRAPGDEAGRALTLRWGVLGPIVARGGSGRARWLGERVEATDIDIRQRSPREDADRR